MIYNKRNSIGFYQVFVKCDACGITAAVTSNRENQTDKCLAHAWIREFGWKNRQFNEKWVNFCPECEDEYRKVKRENYFKKLSEVEECQDY